MERKQKDIFEVLVRDTRVDLTHRRSNGSHESVGRTILTEIAAKGDIESLRSLLVLLQTDRKDEVLALLHDPGDDEHCSPLWYAVKWGHTEIVATLCDLDLEMIRPQLDCDGKFNMHIIAIAAQFGDRRIMEALLKLCPEHADRQCSDKDTPLLLTKWNGDKKAAEIAEVILATQSVDIENTNDNGDTPLMGAFKHLKLELCKVFIRNGADISKIIRISENNEPICLVSSGFPTKDIEMRDALLKVSIHV